MESNISVKKYIIVSVFILLQAHEFQNYEKIIDHVVIDYFCHLLASTRIQVILMLTAVTT